MQEVVVALLDWVNSSLAGPDTRVRVTDLEQLRNCFVQKYKTKNQPSTTPLVSARQFTAILHMAKQWLSQMLSGRQGPQLERQAHQAERYQAQRVVAINICSDGLVLALLLEKMTGEGVVMPCGEFVQSQERQRTNVEHVLAKVAGLVGELPSACTAESVRSGDLFTIIGVLVSLIKHHKEPHFYRTVLNRIYVTPAWE